MEFDNVIREQISNILDSERMRERDEMGILVDSINYNQNDILASGLGY
jgi:hypothetical protein